MILEAQVADFPPAKARPKSSESEQIMYQYGIVYFSKPPQRKIEYFVLSF